MHHGKFSWQQSSILWLNLLILRYVRTPILSDKVVEYLESKGVKFATVDDCARAMLQLASRKEVNGESVHFDTNF